MTTVTAGQSATVQIPAGTAWAVSTTGEAQVYLEAGGFGAGYTSWRVTPAGPLVIPPFSAAGQIRLVGISGVTTDSAQQAPALTPAEVAAARGLVSGDGIGVPEYAARYESAIAQAFRLRAPASLPTIPETLPAVVAGAIYYIDPLDAAASDSNAGTSRSLPWKTLGKASSLNPGVGGVILLAADAIFETAEDWATYKARGTAGLVVIDGMRGTASQPITIKPYHPRGWLYSSAYSPKPTIRMYANTSAADWTQEAGYGGKLWSAAWTRSTFTKREALAFFGPDRRIGLAPGHDTDTLDRLTRDYQYVASANKMTVYVPDGTNPVAYYGAMRITGGNAVFQTFWNGGHHLRIWGLRFEDCYPIKVAFASTADTDLTGFDVGWCEFSRTISVFLVCSQSHATPREFGTAVHDCYFENLPHSGIRQSPTTGTVGNTHSWQVYRNIVRTANLSQSYGAGLLYNQSKGGTFHHGWGNYGYDCRNGAGTDGQPGGYVSDIDGSFMYCDTASDTSVFWGNIAERCGVAFQTNRTVNHCLIGNLAIDCASMSQNTASAGNEANKGLVIAHNTWLWTGRIASSSLQAGHHIGGTGVQNWDVWPVFEVSNEQAGINSQADAKAFQKMVFVNNLGINASGAPLLNKNLFRWPETRVAAGALLIAGNAAAGLAQASVLDRDTLTDRTIWPRYMAMVAGSITGRGWVADALNGVARPAAGSPLVAGGEPLNVTYQDIGGRPFRLAPLQHTIGCYELA